jgi:hypothetical protein
MATTGRKMSGKVHKSPLDALGTLTSTQGPGKVTLHFGGPGQNELGQGEAALSHSAVVTNEKRCREARVSSLKQLSNKYRLRHVVCEAARSNKAAKTKTKMATVLPLFRPKHK